MKRLYIFSYGLHPGQVTLETLSAMGECGAVYSHCLDAAAKKQFSRFARRLVAVDGRDRRCAAQAAVRALEKHDTVGFLTYGNPLFLNRTADALIEAAGKKAEVKIFAAVSSFDGLVNMFNLNKFSPPGLRVADTAALLHAPVFTPDTDTLFFVPYALNLPGNESCRAAFSAGLKAAYPPSAPVYLAECGAVSARDKAVKGRVSGIAALLARVNERHTLFVPAAARTAQRSVPSGKRRRA